MRTLNNSDLTLVRQLKELLEKFYDGDFIRVMESGVETSLIGWRYDSQEGCLFLEVENFGGKDD